MAGYSGDRKTFMAGYEKSYKQATNHGGVWHEWSISKLRFQTWGDLGYPIFNQTHAEIQIPQH